MLDSGATYIQSNLEKLSELYDPSFVHRVERIGDGSPVQVCVDARMLDAVEGTGVATYARVLAGCLADAGACAAILDDRPTGSRPRPRIQRWIAAVGRDPRVAIAQSTTGERSDRWSARDVFREAQVFFNLHGRLLPVHCAVPPAVMHWTYPVPLYVEGARNLYTVHDLIPLTDPSLTQISQERHERLVRQIVEKAALLVTVSETMRATIMRELGPLTPPVVNTFQAVDIPLQRDPPLPLTLRTGRYFLFWGTVEPRKNILRLVAAHAESGVDQTLVIVGPKADGQEALEAHLLAAPNVVRLPFQSRDKLIGLIRRARALLFPSLAEGFGLPIVEAMTLGCPVLTSNIGAPAEIAGEAARYVDPHDTASIAASIRELAANDELCASLRTAGFGRARVFTQQAYARRLRAVYAKALALAEHVA